MKPLEKYHTTGQRFMDALKLTTHPMAVRMIRPGEEPPADAARPHQVFGDEVPPCLVFTWCRRTGLPFYITREDVACKPIAVYFGLERLQDPEDLYCAWEMHAAYKKDAAAEKKSREKDARFEPFEFAGIAVGPLHAVSFVPDLAMLYCSPLALSHLILAATYEGESLACHFNGMESSCKEGIIRTRKTGQCQVVAPGMGDRVLGGVQDHEMCFSIPEPLLETVKKNLFKAGSKIQPPPFGMPHPAPTLGAGKLMGAPVEPGVWPHLRTKFAQAREEK